MDTGQVDKKAVGLTVAAQCLLPSLALETLLSKLRGYNYVSAQPRMRGIGKILKSCF